MISQQDMLDIIATEAWERIWEAEREKRRIEEAQRLREEFRLVEELLKHHEQP